VRGAGGWGGCRVRLTGVALALAAATASVAGAAAAVPAFSTASPHVVQGQPAAGSCHARGRGLFILPDRRCTPGLRNPAAVQARITATICAAGWTTRVRPPESITEPEKRASMAAYGDRGPLSAYEYDHLIPLELGGAVNAAGNLWPEPDYPHHAGVYANPKDRLEDALHRLVCAGRLRLLAAQELIATNWVAAYRTYG